MQLTTLMAAIAMAAPLMTQTDLSDPAEPWADGTTGVTRDLPVLFEPVRVDGQTARCWGREYMLAAPFPTQVTSQDEALLAGPIRVVVETGGERHVLAEGPVELGEVRDDRIEFSGASAAGPVSLTTSGWLEYDGCMQVTLAASGDATVERLAIEIPLRPEIAQFMHVSSQWGKYIYERIGDVGWRWQSDWQALAWFGDHNRGLTFVTQRPAKWVGAGDNQLQVEHAEEAVVFRANLISEPTVLGARDWTIGLQATPGKPMPDRWHGLHVGQGGLVSPEEARRQRDLGQTVALMWNSLETHFSYPEPSDPEAFRAAVEAYHDAGMQVVIYITLSGVGPAEVHQRHLDEWMMQNAEGEPLFAQEPDERGFEGFSSTCPASGFADWLVWAVDRAMEDYDLDGVYIDNAGPYYCHNEAHGCGGEDGVRYPYFATRELHKRLWNVVHGRKPETGVVWEHNSRTSNSFNLTFCDVYSDGEHFRVISEGTPEQITRLLLDVTGSGKQWGARPCFLPSALNLREEYTDWMLCRLLPWGNVMMSVPSWFDYSRQIPVQQARLRFGLGRTPVSWYTPEATPQWLPVGPEELWVGGYQTSDSRVMLTLGNPTQQKLAARMDLRPVQAQLGGEVEITDALTGAPCPPIGRNMVLAVPANSFRIVTIEPRAAQ